MEKEKETAELEDSVMHVLKGDSPVLSVVAWGIATVLNYKNSVV